MRFKDQNTLRNINRKGQVHEVSDENENSIGNNWFRGDTYYILARNLSVFAHTLTLCEKQNLQDLLQISRHHIVQVMVWVLFAAFSQIYSENQE